MSYRTTPKKKQASKKMIRRAMSTPKGWMSLHSPLLSRGFPDRTRTFLDTTMECYLPVTSLATAGNYMDVLVNSVYHPFQTTYVVNTSANSYSFHGAFVNGYSSTVNPPFLSSFATLYEFYKVLRFSLVVTVQPQTGGDTVTSVICPLGNEEIPSTAAASVNLLVFGGQSKAKMWTSASTTAAKYNTRTLSMRVSESLKWREQLWLDQPPTLVTQQPASAQSYVGIFLQGMDGASNTSPIVVSIKLTQEVEFSGLLPQIS